MNALNRRRVLRGMVNGGAVTVGLPLLNCFLNSNGTALASGAPIPVRFGTWYWGLGMQKAIFEPKKIGTGYDLPEEIKCLKDVQKHINLFTNFTAFRDNMQNLCHHTGWVIARTGSAPLTLEDIPAETVDVTISNQIGRTRRFKTLTANAAGDEHVTYSYEGANTPNPPEYSPLNFYTRLFGPDFQDPNAATFKANPRVMVRKSVLSGVMNEIKDITQDVGAEDKVRLDQYFTGLRHLEQQFDQQLTKPEPIAVCHPQTEPQGEMKFGNEASLVAARHKMLTDLMVMAVACDQTRVFNMALSAEISMMGKPGYEKPYHTTTHEEPVNYDLGYQEVVSWFTRRSMECWVDFVQAFAAFKEGDGTLLDHVFIVANTDHGYARVHSLDGIPMFTAGSAGGKVKSGLHIDGKGSSVTRLSYTAMRLMGLENETFGTNSNKTSQDIGEILV